METYLHVGGLVAAGFDPTCEYLLTISHSGRGVFQTSTWTRVARDKKLAYPKGGFGIGIGPIDGQAIPITEKNYETGEMTIVSPDGRYLLDCDSSRIRVVAGGSE